MSEYIDILLTVNGVFCIAPPWVVKEGDMVCLPDALNGEDRVLEVISVSTDEKHGKQIEMLEKYIGYPLPKIKAKYMRNEVEWDEDVSE